MRVRANSAPTVDMLLLTAQVIWGVNYTAVKVALRDMNPLVFNSVRFLLASVVLLTLVFSTHAPGRFNKRTIARLFLIGLVGTGLNQALYILGIYRTSAGIASLIFASTPIFVTVLNWSIGIERVEARGWIGILLSFLGILLMIDIESWEQPLGLSSLIGSLLILGATVCWATYTALSRPVLSSVNPLQFVAYTVALGTPFLILVSIQPLANQNFGAVSWVSWAALVFSAIFAVAFAFVVWYTGVQKIGSTRTAIYQNLQPLVAVLVAWGVLSEKLLPMQLLGAGLVFLGIYLTRFSSQQKRDLEKTRALKF